MEPLADPLDDRMCKEVIPPPVLPLDTALLFPTSGSKVPDWRLVNTHVSKEGKLSKEDFVTIIKEVTDLMKREPNMLEMEEPIVIVGDIHGQYYDLCHLIEKAGDPSHTNYLFMGDYVDRGIFSVECIILLFCLKLNFPETFTMLRGNHECRNMTDHFTFREETIKKFDQEVYDLIMDAFDALPLSCLVGKKYFVMHGGISPDLKKIDQVNKLERLKEPPLDGLMCDLLWSDPADDDIASKTEYIDNEERECSFVFGKKPCKKLLDKNNLMTIVRAHQVQIEGYKMHRWDGASSFPYVITIFSAPNYCDYYSNKASVLILENGNVIIN